MKIKDLIKVFSLVFGVVIMSSCKTYSDNDKVSFDEKIKKFVKKSSVSYEKSESGLYYFIENEGQGEAIKLTDEVSFTYTGRLLNGNVFDSKFSKKPVTFKVKDLIMGWQEAMMYIKKGGKAKLIIPPQLGYGDYELNDIPKNSVLLYDIEIVSVN
jgi:FKBP-type peptidyl-prolyl cis-trans isomerase FkpA